MEPTDESRVQFIEDLRARLSKWMPVDRLLDHIDFISFEDRDRIRATARTAGDIAAANLLIDAVIKKPHSLGWFGVFVDALKNSGCEHAADYMQVKSPDPEEEAENDKLVQLIHILSPSLVEMKTEEVYVHCHSEGLITEEDSEFIRARIDNEGSRKGARELLKCIISRRREWFSQFLEILRRTEHKHLYELTGGSPDPDSPGASLKNKSKGAEGVVEKSPPAAEGGPDSVGFMVLHVKEDPQNENTDLYTAASTGGNQLVQSPEPSEPDRAASVAAAARAPERNDISLRDYQMDVARPALEGKNVIICLPTGSGKTRVAVYITKEHLDGRRAEGLPGKVVVLVNKIPLVEQHYTEEFLPFLKPTYKVERVSGDSQLKISFAELVKNNDVIICTAKILENFLERADEEEDEGVKLSDLTLMVIDECHHTQKGEVYNHIMMRYLKQKHKNKRRRKEQKKPVPLPQILGLTASPGVGGASDTKKAVEHILRICANLDALKIMTSSLGPVKKDPRKTTLPVDDRLEDPFGDVIKKIMKDIHTHASLQPNCDLGSQSYEQWIVGTEREAAAKDNYEARVCAEHLRQYSEGLNLSNIIRMSDAFNFLNEFYEIEMKKKVTQDQEDVIKITDTERFLFNLFKDNKEELQKLAGKPQYENNSLSKLRGKILHEFSSREEARGIIFTKTRRSAISLSQWIQENSKFADIGVKASYVIGGGDKSNVKPMTAAEQKEVLKNLKNGAINLLIATTVAEEGLDIPACNFVIRYGLVTNEIAMIQAEGRGRAEDSSYTLVEVKNTGVVEKECVNEYRKSLMYKAITKIGALPHEEYEGRITDFQIKAICEGKMMNEKKKKKDIKNTSPSEVTFGCRGCGEHVCTGDNIQIIEGMHRVNVTPQFRELYKENENQHLQDGPLEYQPKCFIACKKCGRDWGPMMVYHGIDCPCLNVKNFVVELLGKKNANYTKWSDLPIRFSAFDYAEHATQIDSDSDEDD